MSDARLTAAVHAGCDTGKIKVEGGIVTPDCVYPACGCRMPLRIQAALKAADAAACAQAEGLAKALKDYGHPHIPFGAVALMREAATALSALAAENERLRAGLNPFARIATALDNLYTPEVGLFVEEWSLEARDAGQKVEFTVSDFLRARALLSPPTREAPGIAAPTEDGEPTHSATAVRIAELEAALREWLDATTEQGAMWAKAKAKIALTDVAREERA